MPIEKTIILLWLEKAENISRSFSIESKYNHKLFDSKMSSLQKLESFTFPYHRGCAVSLVRETCESLGIQICVHTKLFFILKVKDLSWHF